VEGLVSRVAPTKDPAYARYQEKITAQMKRLGGSFDWDRVAFTMDDVGVDQEMPLEHGADLRT
jgi:hypothetical protein